MPVTRTRDHECKWKRLADELTEQLRVKTIAHDALVADRDKQIAVLVARINKLEHEAALAKKQLLGPKRERMPEPEPEATSQGTPDVPSRMPTPDEEAKVRERGNSDEPPRGGHRNPSKRKENRQALQQLPAIVEPHPIPDAERRCASWCETVRPIGKGDVSIEYEWRKGRLVRIIHVVETGRCPCKQHYARGPAPLRVEPGCKYGPGLIAKLVVDKCADATPIYRVEKQMRRAAIPIARSTLNDLVHTAGRVLTPLWFAALREVRCASHLQADETSCRLQTSKERCFVWTFLSQELTVYFFSDSRSGDTPRGLLGGTQGSLTVDGYTGYNHVSHVDGRERTGCWSHARRYLFDAWPTARDARDGLDIILDLFMVERLAINRGIAGTQAHLELRRSQSVPILNNMLVWVKDTSPKHDPASPMGGALRYIRNQFHRLVFFTDDPNIPIHNNASEAALRIVALIRKNSLFFGNEDAARRYMVLLSLIATCENHDINPEGYLRDVLIRVQDHPHTRLAELLPHRWKNAFGSGFKVDRIETPRNAA